MAKILVVEDHPAISEGLAAYLRGDGHETDIRHDGSDLEALAPQYDLFILDVMLPGRDGFALARVLRSLTEAPFLFLTAKTDEDDRLTGWDLGARDYVCKPFSPRELVRRVRALLGKGGHGTRTFASGEHTLVVDPVGHHVSLDGVEVGLTPGEWSLLLQLTGHPGVTLSRKALMSEALSYYVDTGERTVDTHLKNLRAKLLVPWIETVRGFGYRFIGLPSGGA